MSTKISNIFNINGVIDTSKPVMANMQTLAKAANSWVTFDIHTGKWSIVINKENEDSVYSFNDDNIVGSITISGSGLTDFYNRVELQFPHKDLVDQNDYMSLELLPEDKYPNEQENTLNLQFDCVNEPVQAQILASTELKQSRVDKIIQFRSDFSAIGLKAGDIIDVTNDTYGYDKKLFRILTITEEDGDDNLIVVNISAFEYDNNVYNVDGLVREDRQTQNTIVSKCVNEAIQNSDSQQTANSLWPMLAATAATGLFNLLWKKNPITGKIETVLSPKEGINDALLTAMAKPNIGPLSGSAGVCAGNTASVSIMMCVPGCADVSSVKLPYEITGVTTQDITIPLKGEVPVSGSGGATLEIPTQGSAANNGDKTMTVKIGSQTKAITIHPKRGYLITASPSSIAEGGTTTLTFTTEGIPDNTSVNFKVSGDTQYLSSISETGGSVTIVGDTATLEVVTKNLDSIQNASITFSLDSSQFFYCAGEDATITITYTGTPPEPPEPTYPCEWVSVPTAWCGSFKADGTAVEVFPVSTIQVLKAISGQPSITVPLTATVSGTTITPATTVDIDASSAVGGIVAKVITSFDALTPGVKRVTGATTQVIGRI